MRLTKLVLVVCMLIFISVALVASVQPMITAARATSPPVAINNVNVSEEMLPCNYPENLVDDAINAPPPTTSNENESVVQSPMVPSRNLGDAATTSPPILTTATVNMNVSPDVIRKSVEVTVLKMPYEITGLNFTSGTTNIAFIGSKSYQFIPRLQSRSASMLL
ncbi:MAG: hypothetical protein PHZ07_01900 [Patescibacteria group bacterium]|nr:hypothetical protein [Patescibacteria group bacterium]MDD4304061.1 hypothetical protein [Patescibacteria group bacterium]MDD4694938.1 hypothetical protein [Patescibacteria group bacterium]